MPAPSLRRRDLGRLSGVALTSVALGACASRAVYGAGSRNNAQALRPAPVQLASGVWVLRGRSGEISPVNRGKTANLGLVIGSRGALAVDSGVSSDDAHALMAAARPGTSSSISALVLTHVRQEFVFGASTLQDLGTKVIMHQQAAQLMAARCERCLSGLRQVLGMDEMQGARVVRPDRVFGDAKLTLDSVLDIGRAVEMRAYGPNAHSAGPGNLTVFDVASRTLFAGGLLDATTIPDIQDANLDAWRAALGDLRALNAQHIVPGHGPIASNPADARYLIDSNLAYLRQLSDATLALVRRGATLSEVAEAAHLPDFAGWDQYDSIHARNANIMYLHHERALFR